MSGGDIGVAGVVVIAVLIAASLLRRLLGVVVLLLVAALAVLMVTGRLPAVTAPIVDLLPWAHVESQSPGSSRPGSWTNLAGDQAARGFVQPGPVRR